MALVDVYDALVSARRYKPAVSRADAAKIINDGKGQHFDPALVDIFNKVSEKFASIAGNGSRPATASV
jgi:putative two-component system response regulator